ncbi:MAG: DUF1559 domain-containing protein [Pirellulales bacterium]|nr:DUF1559 domain-containing protein [Pirellulales bacterium]
MVQVTPPAGWTQPDRSAPPESTRGEASSAESPAAAPPAPTPVEPPATEPSSLDQAPPSTPEPAAPGSNDRRWTRAAGVVPPPLPRQRPAADASTSPAAPPVDMAVGLSPTEQLWRQRLLWVGLPAAVLIVVVGLLMMVFSGKQPATTTDKVVQTVPDTRATTDTPTPELPSASTLDAAWVPDGARLVVSLAPSRMADRSGKDRLAKASAFFWKPVVDKVLAAFELRPDELQRVTWSTGNLSNLAVQSVVVIEVEPDCDLTRLAGASTPTKTRFGRTTCRRLNEATWTQPFALVRPHTLVTGRPDVLKALGTRIEPHLASQPLAKLLGAPARECELSVLVDLEAARRAGWRLPEGALNVWPDGVEPWQTLWRLPEGFAVDLCLDGATMHSRIDLVCGDAAAAETILAAVERLVPAAKTALAEKAQAWSEKPQIRATVEQPGAYLLLLQEGVAALDATRWESLDTMVRVETDWGQDFSGIGPLALDLRDDIRRDWLAVAAAFVERQQLRLVDGLDDYRRAKGVFPAAAVGGALLPPETRLSWIATLLPYCDHRDWHERLKPGYPWDDAKNEPVTRQVLPEVVNPTFGPATTEGGFPVTHYVGSAGLGAEAARLPANDPRAGVFGFGRETHPRQIKDGASNTIAILGVCREPGPWAAGGRPTTRGLTQQPYVNGPDGFGTGQADGMYVGMADGSARFLSKDADPRIIEHLVTINGGEPPPSVAVPDEPPAEPVEPTDANDEVKPAEPDEPEPVEIPPAILAQLERPLVAAQFDDVELGNVIHFVEEMSTLKIRVDQAALAAVGISLDTPLSVEQKRTTVGRLLEAALDQCGLVYTVRDGQLWVTSPDTKTPD